MSEARVVRPDRRQLRWDMIDLDGLLPSDHRARVVWSFVESLDLAELYDQVRLREGEAGRPAGDPAVLVALWLYATVEGIGSARELERLAQSDVAYRWLAGGVPRNYHGLADFRVEQVEVLDRLLTQSVTALIGEGLVTLAEIAVDSTKIRASASRRRSRRATNCSRWKPRSPSDWPPSSGSLRMIRAPRTVGARRLASAPRARSRSAPPRRARRSNGLRRSASRGPRGTPRMKPRRRSRGLRRPIPRRASCASPTGRCAR